MKPDTAAGKPIPSTSGLRIGSSFLREIVRNKYLYALTVPAMLYFLVFSYVPMFGIVIAFQDFNPIKGIGGSEFVGWRNLDFFFTSNDWLTVTFNTFYLNALFIVTGLAFQIAFAIMIAEMFSKTFKKIVQSISLFPYFISWPVVSMFSIALFATDEGMINNVLKSIGVDPINFYQDPSVWPTLLVLFKIWKGTGYGVVIYLATIASIDQEIYEAAKIDGASRIQGIRYITLPMLTYTTILLVILAVGRIFFGDFGMIYALIGDNTLLYPTTDVIDTFVYRALRSYGDMSMSSAVGLYQSVVGFILVLVTNGIVRKWNKDSSLF